MIQQLLDFSGALRARNRMLDLSERVTSDEFRERAAAHIVGTLRERGPSSGEVLVSLCEAAGIRSTSSKHFGTVFAGLNRRRVIECVGYGLRAKGHGTAGSRIWRLRA